MVLPLNVYRRSLVRSNNPRESLRLPRTARSARTPPSTFLFLPIQLSNSPGPKPLSHLREPPVPEPTTNDNRQPSAVCALISVRSWRHGNMPRPVGLGSAVLSGRVISPAFVYCQRQSSTNCRIATHSVVDPPKGRDGRKGSTFPLLPAALEPQCCDVLG